MRRRDFLKAASSLALVHGVQSRPRIFAANTKTPAYPIIDAHIHLFDPSRPGGIPWPEKSDTVLYRPALPPRYKHLAKPFGVVGAIAVECSPLVEDNDWLLRVAASDTMIVAVIGDLDPVSPKFPKQLEILAANPLFRGIRYGNLWGRNLGEHVNNSVFIANLKELSNHGLLLESANPNPALIADILMLTDRIPELGIVIDHLPQAVPPESSAARKSYEHDLRALSRRTNVFIKGSEVLRLVDGKIPTDLDFYRPWLDEIWEIFGEDRLIYGSDWPNSDHLAPYDTTFNLMTKYVTGKGQRALENFFWRNSAKAYRWQARTTDQRRLAS
jgi:L-fuconolactonase